MVTATAKVLLSFLPRNVVEITLCMLGFEVFTPGSFQRAYLECGMAETRYKCNRFSNQYKGIRTIHLIQGLLRSAPADRMLSCSTIATK